MEHPGIQKVGFPAFPGTESGQSLAWRCCSTRAALRMPSRQPSPQPQPGRGEKTHKIKSKLQSPAARHALEVGNDAERGEVISIFFFFFSPFFCSPSGQCQAAPGGECPNFGTVVGVRLAQPGAAPARTPSTPSPLGEPGRAVPGTHPLRGLRGEDRRGRRPGERGLGGGGSEATRGGTRRGGI